MSGKKEVGILTQEEKMSRMRQVEAGLAFGGGSMTPQMRKDLEDVMDGKKTTDQIRSEIIERYRR